MKVGDLVYVAKPTPCCRNETAVGRVFMLETVGFGLMHCGHCRFKFGVSRYVRYGNFGISFERLCVIPPLNELEAEKAVEHA